MTQPRDLVVVGGSAGGVEALTRFVSDLPTDLPATVLVGLHLSMRAPSILPALLARRTSLEVVPAAHGVELLPGRVIVGVPDAHMLVVDDHVVLGHGARENGHRPSHDAMMRSAAVARGPRTVGVVITGLLDDGSVGLRAVERYGGACLVQCLEDAAFPDMPASALRAVPTAGQVALPELASEVARLIKEPLGAPVTVPQEQRDLDDTEIASALGREVRMPDGSLIGEPSEFACPSCHGVLNTVPDEHLRYRCRTGHAWTAESLIVEQGSGVEAALWAAMRALEERADLAGRMAQRAEAKGREWSVAHYRHSSDQARQAAEAIRPLLMRSALPPELSEPSA